jgi:8-oxo-dGTP pyrophosphatase MutT (NUDIX family)
MAEAAKARPASTILLLRDSPGPVSHGEIEVFMMVRHYEIDFNSGALVFPGGSVDAGDHDIAGKSELYAGGEGLDAEALGFRIAAIRETFEESGILLAKPRGSSTLVDAKRAGEIDLGFAARGAGGRRKRPLQAAVSDHAQFDQARQASHRQGCARRRPGQAGRYRNAGHDQGEWRPPAAHPGRRWL